MPKQFIETHDRVFGLEVRPDTPGYCQRQLIVTLESGQPLADEQWREIIDAAVADMEARGIDVHGWRIGGE